MHKLVIISLVFSISVSSNAVAKEHYRSDNIDKVHEQELKTDSHSSNHSILPHPDQIDSIVHQFKAGDEALAKKYDIDFE